MSGLGVTASASFNVDVNGLTGGGGGGGGSATMWPCNTHGGLVSMLKNSVGGYKATCGDGFSCNKTSSITDEVCTPPSKGGAPPPPPPPAAPPVLMTALFPTAHLMPAQTQVSYIPPASPAPKAKTGWQAMTGQTVGSSVASSKAVQQGAQRGLVKARTSGLFSSTAFAPVVPTDISPPVVTGTAEESWSIPGWAIALGVIAVGGGLIFAATRKHDEDSYDDMEPAYGLRDAGSRRLRS